MQTRRLRALTGWTGIAFFVLSGIVLFLVPLWPPAGAPMEQILSYYGAHRTPFLVGNYLAALAAVPGLIQIAGLAALVREAEREGAWLWLAVLVSGGAAHAVGLVVLLLFQALPFVAVPGSEGAARALSEAANVGFGFFFVPIVATAAALGAAIVRTRIMAPWLGHAAWAVGGAAFVASLGSIWPTGMLASGGLASVGAFTVFFAWVLATSVVLRGAPPPRATQS
jgi:hypothetical protein